MESAPRGFDGIQEVARSIRVSFTNKIKDFSRGDHLAEAAAHLLCALEKRALEQVGGGSEGNVIARYGV